MVRIASTTCPQLTGIDTRTLLKSISGLTVAGSGKEMLNHPKLAYNLGKDRRWPNVWMGVQLSEWDIVSSTAECPIVPAGIAARKGSHRGATMFERAESIPVHTLIFP